MRRVELQHIIAGDVFRLAGAVVVERAHAGIGPDQFVGRELVAEISVGHIAEIGDLVRIGRRRIQIADEIFIRRADQREVVGERQREDDAAVGGLQNIAAVVIETLAHDDVAAFDQAHARFERCGE